MNIGSEKEPKFATIGNHWDEEIVSKVIELLHEYQELFPTMFLEMKGIIGYPGVMKISLMLDAKVFKKRSYTLNLNTSRK